MKILCTIEGFAPEALQILQSIGDAQVKLLKQNELLAEIPEYDCLVVQLGLNVDCSVIDAAPNLKYIATATTGVDHIDVAYAESKGIQVLSLQGETKLLESITPTAELAFGLMIVLVRKVVEAHEDVLRNKWNRFTHQGHSLAGMTLGIVGYGRLGKLMGRYCTALGMQMVYTDPNVEGSVPLQQVLQSSDVVSLHAPLTKETEGMIGAKELALMKPTAHLVNTARGKIVDEAAIIDALEKKMLAGYAADVLRDEWSFTKENAQAPIIEYAKTHTNVILTPHIGGTTKEARELTDVFIVKKLKKAIH